MRIEAGLAEPAGEGLRLPARADHPVADRYSAFKIGDTYGEPIPSLVFRLKDGRRVAKAYHWLGEVVFDPGEGVRLVFPDATFALGGQNLLPLFTALSEHAVQWVWEVDRSQLFLLPPAATVVESIERSPGRA